MARIGCARFALFTYAEVGRGVERHSAVGVGMRELNSPRTLLHQLIRERRSSYEQLTQELDDFARKHGIDGTISVRHLQRLARNESSQSGGRTSALGGTQRLLEEYFGHPFNLLVGPSIEKDSLVVPTAYDPRSMTTSAAQAAMDFLTWASDDRVPEPVLDHVLGELRRVAADYVHMPVLPLFADMIDLRDTAVGLLRNRPHPRQARELFYVAGTVSTLLAHASQNMGNAPAARTQAATAWACAEESDDDDLRAWVRGTQGLIAEWTLHYRDALEFVREGQRFASSPEQQARLAAIEARTLARAGDASAALEAMSRANRARELPDRADRLSNLGGILTFPRVKQMYYAGSTLVLAGEAARGEQACVDVISSYETGPLDLRSYGDEAIARVDLALAHLLGDDLDGASEALQPVFQLPTEQRIRQITDSLTRVRERLLLPRYGNVHAAQALVNQLNQFADLTYPTRPPTMEPS